MLNFVKENGFGAILLLTGADVTNRSDSQMLYVSQWGYAFLSRDLTLTCYSTPSYVRLPPNAPSLERSPIQLASKLRPYTYEPSIGRLEGTESLMPRPAIPIVPGGGLTRRLLSAFSTGLEKPIPIAAIVQFVVEGDNRGDAEFFARTTSHVVGIEVDNFKQPPSWKNGLFGTPHDQSLYG